MWSDEQLQPVVIPRPDVAALGINYRRIPLMSIGRDVYLDTRLIIQKLEDLHPEKPRLGATKGSDKALEHLLEIYSVDSGLFANAFRILPGNLPLFQDQGFLKDRGDFLGGTLTREAMDKGRPEALNEVKKAFEFLEHGLLADGREWLLGTDGPRVADIDAIFPLHWVSEVPGALPTEIFSDSTYPKTMAWIKRFKQAVNEGQKSLGRAEKVSGEDALKLTTTSPWNESPGPVDQRDSVIVAEGLNAGDLVTVWPTDSGFSHKDTGRLVSLTSTEVVIETNAKDAAGTALRVHAPRHGFRVTKAPRSSQTRL